MHGNPCALVQRMSNGGHWGHACSQIFCNVLKNWFYVVVVFNFDDRLQDGCRVTRRCSSLNAPPCMPAQCGMPQLAFDKEGARQNPPTVSHT